MKVGLKPWNIVNAKTKARLNRWFKLKMRLKGKSCGSLCLNTGRFLNILEKKCRYFDVSYLPLFTDNFGHCQLGC